MTLIHDSAAAAIAAAGVARPLPAPPEHFDAPQYAHVPEELRKEDDPWEVDINDFVVST